MESPSAPAAGPENPHHERQLDATGRAAAQAMGQAMGALHLSVAEIWSSPAYRARETVGLADLPAPRIAPELGDRGQIMQAADADQGAWLRARATEPPRRVTDTIIVTHILDISAAFGEMATGLGHGGMLVFRPHRGRPPHLVGRIAIEEWPRLASR